MRWTNTVETLCPDWNKSQEFVFSDKAGLRGTRVSVLSGDAGDSGAKKAEKGDGFKRKSRRIARGSLAPAERPLI